MEKATRQQIKEHNRNLVLNNIFEHDRISRAEIARITRLTATTVSEIVAYLIDEGLVVESGVGSSLGGKSPILLSLVEDSRRLIGLDLAHNQFHGAVVNLRGKICSQETVPVGDRTGEDALALVYQILDKLIAAAPQPLLGIGIGTPGLVNPNEGVVINAVNLNWKDLPLAHLLQQRYDLPVSVLNDSQAAAIAEHTYGKRYRDGDHLIVINARHGIGSGIIINGELFQGNGGSAGEIGHIVVVPEGGLPCRCGNRGCLETVASAQALLRRAQTLASASADTQLSRSPHEITLDAIEAAFKQGDPLATQAVLETARYLGMAISSLVEILNIQRIVLTGDMTRFGQAWVDEIEAVMARMSLSAPSRNTRLEIGHLGGNGIILGASAMLVNSYSLLFQG